ncbi:uncharacterized protein LOC118197397 [Stegodyphus dumicola]|uniref:uncharacterized protein LOC118197397 n=1 Tax=Stegodyphus dumicola TaxID=202533 RepID=UPI0015A8A93A|nr:uncharacterized protein LOC118197397 [Stegodyphus dumicola]
MGISKLTAEVENNIAPTVQKNMGTVIAQPNNHSVSTVVRPTPAMAPNTATSIQPMLQNAHNTSARYSQSEIIQNTANLDLSNVINKDTICSTLSIKCIQINLQRAKAAVAQLAQFAAEFGADLIMAQEPYTRDGIAVGFPLQWTIYQQGNVEYPPRAIIINCNKKWSPAIVAIERDNVAIIIEAQEASLLFISQYSPPSADILATTQFLTDTLQKIKIPLKIITGDYNAHNTVWGYASTNDKGSLLEDFLSANHLVLHNTADAPPTYDRIYAQGWPDLTVSSASAAPLIQNWRVNDEISLSDHRYITFSIEQPTTINIIRRYNLPGRRKRAFTTRVKNLFEGIEQQLTQANSRDELENFTVTLQKCIQQACDDILPQRSTKKLTTINWWSSELRIQQRQCRALRRRLKTERRLNLNLPAKTPSQLSTQFIKARAKYKRSILQAKINSWHAFCTESQNIYGIHHKIMTGKLFRPAQLHIPTRINVTQDYTRETLIQILDSVFSQDDPTEDSKQQATIRTEQMSTNVPPDRDITLKELNIY